MKKKILLIGGGGHCHSVIDVIELENKCTIVGIIDKKEFIGQDVLGYKIIGCDDDLPE
ncbi:MAG: acetyltransferase, partial [Sulfurimonas sp.]|nr:acetyltransferase [Sulfurimonas sp.]